jgi:hypothetical protein
MRFSGMLFAQVKANSAMLPNLNMKSAASGEDMESSDRIFSYLTGAFFFVVLTAMFILPRPVEDAAGAISRVNEKTSAAGQVESHAFQPVTINVPGTVPQGRPGAWSNTTYTVPSKKRLVLEHIYIRATSSFGDDAIEAAIASGYGAELSAIASACIDSAPAGYRQGYTCIGNQPVKAYFEPGDTLRFKVTRTYAYSMHSPVYYGVVATGRLFDLPSGVNGKE